MISRGSEWIEIEGGRLGASGAPGRGGIAYWQSIGATGVITLLRDNEMRNKNIEEQCREHGLVWLHLPLEGRRSFAQPSIEDRNSILQIPQVVNWLRSGRSVIVHCAAGMHRTGFVCYLTLRLAGLSCSESLDKVREMRPVTYEELVVRTRNHPKTIQELAEEWLLNLEE